MKIRMLVLAGALALPGLAFAGDAATKGASMDKPAKAEKGAAKGKQSAAHFETAQNFEAKGTVEKLDARGKKLTLGREDEQLPSFALQIPADAEIMIDGEKGELSKIQKGSDVRATFNIVDDKPLAVKLDVTSAKDEPGAKQPKTQPMPDDTKPMP